MPKRYPVVLISAAFLFTAVVYQFLPPRLPTQFTLGGEVTGWRGRLQVAFLLPMLALVTWLVMRGLPFGNPRNDNYPQFAKTYNLAVCGLVTFLLFAHLLVLGMALHWPLHGFVAPAVVGVVVYSCFRWKPART